MRSVDENRLRVSERTVDQMTYKERLENYNLEKSQIPRTAGDSKTYEAALKALAKKWRV